MAAGDILYSAWSSLVTYLTTTLNSLANGAIDIGSSVFLDNTTVKHHNLAAELQLASVDLSAQTGLTVELYLVPSIDESNYCDSGTDASTTDLPPGSAHVGTFTIQKTNAAHRSSIVCKECLEALKYTVVLKNMTGVAFAAADNILKMKTNSDQVAS